MANLQRLDSYGGLYQPAAGLRARVEELLSPQAREALDLSYDCADIPTVTIGGLGVPCFLHPPRQGSGWELVCPWWMSEIPEDVFEDQLMSELGKVRHYVTHMLAPVDPSRLN